MHSELAGVIRDTVGGILEPLRFGPDGLPDRVPEERDSEDLRAELAAWERRVQIMRQESVGRLREEACQAYDSARNRSWRELLGADPRVATGEEDLLEAAGEDTYLALQATDGLLGASSP